MLKDSFYFTQTSSESLSHLKIKQDYNTILVFFLDTNSPVRTSLMPINEIRIQLSKLASDRITFQLGFISSLDKFNLETFYGEIQNIVQSDKKNIINLLIPYLAPPIYSYREDGAVSSFIISDVFVDKIMGLLNNTNFDKITYRVVTSLLNLYPEIHIAVYQLGKSGSQNIPCIENPNWAEDAQITIPHRGSLKLLSRCLSKLNIFKHVPSEINVCFDDLGHKKFRTSDFKNLLANLKVFFNNPEGLGPYFTRDNSIKQTSKKYIFFHDSDDISVENRFQKQICELEQRHLDMVGSHELRIDQLKKRILAIRFPADANFAIQSNKGLHSLLHPTSMIKKSEYLKVGGFSTDRRFGYDTQFLLRSSFSLKIGNVDDFLYIRFRRHNSLTTSKKTSLKSQLRMFLLWRWRVDYRLVVENKLLLEQSSLKVSKCNAEYKFQKVN